MDFFISHNLLYDDILTINMGFSSIMCLHEVVNFLAGCLVSASFGLTAVIIISSKRRRISFMLSHGYLTNFLKEIRFVISLPNTNCLMSLFGFNFFITILPI